MVPEEGAGKALFSVVPAQAGTHNPRRGYGSRLALASSLGRDDID
jgi:hypothetical protein